MLFQVILNIRFLYKFDKLLIEFFEICYFLVSTVAVDLINAFFCFFAVIIMINDPMGSACLCAILRVETMRWQRKYQLQSCAKLRKIGDCLSEFL